MDEAAGVKCRKFASTGTLHHPNCLAKQNINKHKLSKVLFAGKISTALQATTENTFVYTMYFLNTYVFKFIKNVVHLVFVIN